MSTYQDRLAALREQLKADRLDGFVVPLTDEHMSEYVGSYAQRLAWLTGFQGSAGAAVVLPEDAPSRDRVLTLAESQALWDSAHKPHERMYLALAYGTLARPEAILALHRSFVDFDRWLLAQNPPGRRQTRKYRPTVPVAGCLRQWLQEAPDGPLVAWWRYEDHRASLKRTIARYGTTRKPCRIGAGQRASDGIELATRCAESIASLLWPEAVAPIQMKCRLCG